MEDILNLLSQMWYLLLPMLLPLYYGIKRHMLRKIDRNKELLYEGVRENDIKKIKSFVKIVFKQTQEDFGEEIIETIGEWLQKHPDKRDNSDNNTIKKLKIMVENKQ